MQGGVLATCAVMATYGLFVPNGRRRAALLVAPMALMPVAVALIAGWVAEVEQASDNALMLLFVAIASVFEGRRRGTRCAEGAEACSFGPLPAPRADRHGGDGRGLPGRIKPANIFAAHLIKLIK
jgi:hypothetical protein